MRNKELLFVLLMMLSVPITMALQPADDFTFAVCFNDENGTATTDADGVFGKVIFPNNTVKETIDLTETSETNLPCMWNGTYTIPANETTFGVWSIIVNGSVPDDEKPSTVIQFEVFPPREPFWQPALMVIILGSALVLAYIYANLDQEHFFLKFFFLGMTILVMIVGASVMQSIVDLSNIPASANLDNLTNLLANSYKIITVTLWFFGSYAIVFLIYRVLMHYKIIQKLLKRRMPDQDE